jgi:hypothetical protein
MKGLPGIDSGNAQLQFLEGSTLARCHSEIVLVNKALHVEIKIISLPAGTALLVSESHCLWHERL